MTSTSITLGLAVVAIVLLVNLTGVVLVGFVQLRLRRVEGQGQRLQATVDEASLKLRSLEDAKEEIVAHVDRLAADVVHRELYRDKGSRQKLAIDAVQAGETLQGLMENYGLSSDEAELLLALHGNTQPTDEFRPAA